MKSRSSNKRPKHLAFIRTLICCRCHSNVGVIAAHLRQSSFEHGKANAMAKKPDDKWVTSLCQRCHERQHQMGEETFWAERDPFKLAKALWRYSGDAEAAEYYILNGNWRLTG